MPSFRLAPTFYRLYNTAMSVARILRNQQIQDAIIGILEDPSKGKTFGHLMVALGLDYSRRVDGVAESRLLDMALQGLRRAKEIRFDRMTKEWTLVRVYSLDGRIIDDGLDGFFKLNDNLDPADVAALQALKRNQRHKIGGGAAPVFVIERCQ